jgi:hypothetical protein
MRVGDRAFRVEYCITVDVVEQEKVDAERISKRGLDAGFADFLRSY